jgi:hypothetical protein
MCSQRMKIRKLFHNRCLINPAHKGVVIHHIVTKAHRYPEVEDDENKILLCADCHNLVHQASAGVWRDKLIKLREQWLEKYA